MRKLLNTLYVTTQGAYLSRDGETIAVRIEHETRLALPVHTVEGIVCFGNVSVSPFLMGLCGERGVAITHLTEYGRFLARVSGPVSGNVLLRRQQFRAADNEAVASSIARSVVVGKVANSRVVLQRAGREASLNEELRPALTGLESILRKLDGDADRDTLRALEGEAARLYFGAFDHLMFIDKEHFYFRVRSRRPPLDNVNSLLSFLYTLLVADTAAALESVGLDPQVGFLHGERPGRPSLALDLMEEFRSFLADRLAITLINRRQVAAGDFLKTETGAVHLSDAARRVVLNGWQKRKLEELRHPFIDERIPIGLIPYVQATLLARHLRGDLPEYPPFFWR